MTDLRAMSWPERLKWAVENDLGISELARILGVTPQSVTNAQIRWGIKLRDKRADRMRRLNADPDFAAAHAKRSADRMRRLNAAGLMIPRYLRAMTPEQRADYDTLMGKGYTKAEAVGSRNAR